MNKRVDDAFLQPLKNRPGLTHLKFKQNLKKKLLEEAFQNKNSRKYKHFIPNLLTAALLFLSIYIIQDVIRENLENDVASHHGRKQVQKKDNIRSNSTKEKNSTDFTLTEDEIKAYNNFSKDLNEKHLENLNPISIAKLYVKADLEERYNVTYALYTDRQDFILWTKEEDENIPTSHRGTIEQKQEIYKNIEKGKFVQTSDFEGYIEYQSNEISETKSGFKMVKNENGIWQVSFNPIQ